MNPWSYAYDVTRLGLEAQCVIALRMMRFAAGGALARREANRMVAEKATTMIDAAAAFASARGPHAAAAKALATYQRAVRRNRRRLSRRR